MGEGPASFVGREARRTVAQMGEAATAFMASLAGDQLAKARFPFVDHHERTSWYYTPNERNGLTLGEMDRRQRRLALQLLATGLSRSGFTTATVIMGLEHALDAIEDWKTAQWTRDPLRYYVSLFDSPDPKRPWGWRFNGHHLAVNYTIVGGRIVAPTPTFFGSNPADTDIDGHHALRPLAPVEDLARELLRALDEAQRATATISAAAPPDIVMANRPRVIEGALPLPAPLMMGRAMTAELQQEFEANLDHLGVGVEPLRALQYTHRPKGLAASAMSAAQREILATLLHAYVDRMPDEIAEIETRFLQDNLPAMHFAWAGGAERRQPHYYRLQAPRCLIEYDNTQNDVNHIHSVWRDPEGDFGDDILARHYTHDHHG